jgi:predicted ATPase
MWTRLHLEHFKCFERLALPLAPLTLLTGLNAAGKSTVIQAMALLNQTIRENEWGDCLLLNGTSVRLGTVGDVINDLKGRTSFKIGIESESICCEWTAVSEDRSTLIARIAEASVGDALFKWASDASPNGEPNLHRLIPSGLQEPQLSMARRIAEELRELTYISAERIGPREVYEPFSEDEERTVGVQGERTAYYLFKHQTKLTRETLRIEGTPPQLPRQTEAWLAHFFPGAGFRVEPVAGANLVVMSMRAHHSIDFHRPQNVGFGLTHILPILAACLGANEGSVVLIDNPEAHLHPSGQAAIGRFLAMIAHSGVQLVVETHSDHVLNGIRRAVRDAVIRPEDLALHFFTSVETGEEMRPEVTSPAINTRGQIDRWPNGFFDQFDKDMMVLAEWNDE